MEIINHECYVSLEVAELLKQAGFNQEVKTYYHYLAPYDEYNLEFYSISTNYNHLNNVDFSAPTLDVSQRWLRKIKNVVLLVNFNNDEDCEKNERYGVTVYNAKERIIDLATYPTYEEAQEVGIRKALEIILEKGE